MRRIYSKDKFLKGNGFEKHVIIFMDNEVQKGTYIGIRNILDCSNDFEIGNYVHIAGASTGIWTHSSPKMCLYGIPLAQKDDKEYRSTAPVIIEDNVYIGGIELYTQELQFIIILLLHQIVHQIVQSLKMLILIQWLVGFLRN